MAEPAPEACSSRPDGIIAALLAVAIAATGAAGVCVYARRLADRHVKSISAWAIPFKSQTLTLQRAALASGYVLPVYGSSELYCCGSPYRPTELFASRPAGFQALALGRAGTGDLFFMQTFAALGHDLQGKKVVVSASPSWFYGRQGLDQVEYAANFLPEIAYAFVFDAPISPRVREAAARRLLAYPGTLQDQPLLRMALIDLAQPTAMHRVEYAALAPLGRVATWVLQVRDALRTTVFIWQQRRVPTASFDRVRELPWDRLAERATRIAQAEDTTNPFGFTDATYRQLKGRPRFQRAAALYQSGATNRDGQLLPPPAEWQAAMSHSAGWRDLQLALRVLRELHARPLVWSMPMPGLYDDYTRLSAPARQRYYDRYERVVDQAKLPWLDFRAHDEDRYFLSDPGSHFSSRGWIFADRALTLFWDGQSIDDIRSALASLARQVPPPPQNPGATS